MNKDEILSKSRKENKDRDLYAMEIQTNAGNISSLTALALATVLFVIQFFVEGGFDYGLYAIVFSVGAASFIVKAVSMKHKRDIVLSIIYSIATIILTVIHIYQLISA